MIRETDGIHPQFDRPENIGFRRLIGIERIVGMDMIVEIHFSIRPRLLTLFLLFASDLMTFFEFVFDIFQRYSLILHQDKHMIEQIADFPR